MIRLVSVVVLVPSPAWWVKDPALLLLWHRLQLQLGFDPYPGTSICHRHGQKGNKKRYMEAFLSTDKGLTGNKLLYFLVFNLVFIFSFYFLFLPPPRSATSCFSFYHPSACACFVSMQHASTVVST